jgi:hypothetical protein
VGNTAPFATAIAVTELFIPEDKIVSALLENLTLI